VSQPLAGHHVAIEQLSEFRCRVWFHHIDCGELEILPPWIDDLVPQPPPCASLGSGRHDARRREGRRKGDPRPSLASQPTPSFPSTEPANAEIPAAG
jgi:hypothetical protein